MAPLLSHYGRILLIARVSHGMGALRVDELLDWFLHQGERDGCDPKRALLLYSFGSSFQAEDVFAGYLMPEVG
jgi:hypothetical protein